MALLISVSFQSARANTACESKDDALLILSFVRGVQSETKVTTAETIFSLKQQVENVVTSALLSSEYIKAHPAQSEDFMNYLSQMQDAVIGAENGNLAYADWVLQNSETQRFVATIQSLEHFWNCGEQEEIAPVESQGQSGSNSSLSMTNQSFEEVRIMPVNPVAGRPSERIASQNKGVLRPAKIERRENLEVDYLLLFGMVAMGFAAMIYFVRKRPKPREERRIIHALVRVELGRRIYDMRIVDITANGCKIEHSDKIQGQRKLQVELNGTWYVGQIKWHNSAFAGVKFHRALEVDVFNRVVKAALA